MDVWSKIGDEKAEILPISGTEFFARSGEQSDVSMKISMPFHASLLDIRSDDRIVYGSTMYNIVSVMNVGTLNREMVFMCSMFKP